MKGNHLKRFHAYLPLLRHHAQPEVLLFLSLVVSQLGGEGSSF